MLALLLFIYVLFYRSILLTLLLMGTAFGVINAVGFYEEDDTPKSAYFVTIAFLSMFAYVHIASNANVHNYTPDNFDILVVENTVEDINIPNKKPPNT